MKGAVAVITITLLFASQSMLAQSLKIGKKLENKFEQLIVEGNYKEAADLIVPIANLVGEKDHKRFIYTINKYSQKIIDHGWGYNTIKPLTHAINYLPEGADTLNTAFIECLNNLAQENFNAKKFELANEQYTRLKNILIHAGMTNNDDYFNCLARIAILKLNLKKQDSYTTIFEVLQVLQNETEILVNFYFDLAKEYSVHDAYFGFQILKEVEKLLNSNNITNNYYEIELKRLHGVMYSRLGQISKGVEYLKKALKITESIDSIDIRLVQSIYQNLATAYSIQGEADDLEQYTYKSYELAQKAYDSNSSQMALVYGSLATVFMKKSMIDSSLFYRYKSHRINQAIFGPRHLITSAGYYRISELYMYQKNYIKALQYAQYSLTSNFETANIDSSYLKLPVINGIININALLQSMSMKIYLFERLYKSSLKDFWLIEAEKHYTYLDTLVNILQQSIDEKNLPLLIKINRQIYCNAVDNAYTLNEKTRNPSYFSDAFTYATSLKSKTLAYQILKLEQAQKTPFESNELSKIDEELRSLENEERLCQDLMQKEAVDSISTLIFYKKIKKRDIKNNLVNTNEGQPIFDVGKFQVSTLSIKNELKKEEALIEYFFGNDELFIFCFTADTSVLERVKTDSDFQSRIKTFQKNVKTGSLTPDNSSCVSDLLLKPIYQFIKAKKCLYVVPDGQLYNLSFEALKSQKTNNYLIEDFEIVYAYSSSIWLKSRKRDNDYSYNSIALFAPGFLKNKTSLLNSGNAYRGDTTLIKDKILSRQGNSLMPLPYSVKEINEVEALMNSRWVTNIYTGKDATEEVFRNRSKENRIIHIATHGFSSSKNPELSGLFFSQNSKSKDKLTHSNDGVLYMNELFSINFNADLVVLSACKSGRGKIFEGEGVYGLPRGFIYSGVPNLVVSLWKVHDEKTKNLMLEFYNGVYANISYKEALRTAKLKMIANKELPIDWSGIVLIGN